jgi:hypothetical protein
LTNRLAAEALAERDRMKRNAATTAPGRDASNENLARAKHGGSWVGSDPDSTNAANTGKQRRS